MYRLLKDTIKTFLYASPIGALLVPLWSLIEVIINILIKIFIVFPLYLFSLILKLTNSFFNGYFENVENSENKIKNYKYVLGIIVLLLSAFWLYSTYCMWKMLPFSNSNFIKSISIFGFHATEWYAFLLITLGYTLFCIISLLFEFGFWAIVFSVFNIIGFFNKDCLILFSDTATVAFIFECFFIINMIHPLEFHSEIMKDIEADHTLSGVEKWNYYRNKKNW